MATEKKSRGRPKKDKTIDLLPPFKCSACEFVSNKLEQCQRHICLEHKGQALINDDSARALTEQESILGFNKAIKLLKKLKCHHCEKAFKTGLGLYYHLQICGKNEQDVYKECDICGKRLKLHSLPAHEKALHSTNPLPSVKQQIVNEGSHLQTKPKQNQKRHSAIKALKYLKSLDDAETDETNTVRIECNQKLHDKDKDFFAHSDSTNDSESVNSATDSDSPCSDHSSEHSLQIHLSDRQFDDIFNCIVNYVVRYHQDEDNDEHISKTMPERDEQTLLFRCYNLKCPTRFQFRFELENHYRRCFKGRFFFRCSFNECHSKIKLTSIDEEIIGHFMKHHKHIIPDDILNDYGNYFQHFPTKRQSTFMKSTRWPKLNQNHDDFEKLYKMNASLAKVFCCLQPRMDHYELVDSSKLMPLLAKEQYGSFKSTHSMESGDNELKKVEALSSMTLHSNSIVLNVAQSVSCVAWCPSDGEHEEQDQYLAIATTNTNIEEQFGQEEYSHSFLQLWNVGLLALDGSEKKSRLALNFDMVDYGKIFSMSWCPFGSTYNQKKLVDHQNILNRLGLLAICCEDGSVRMLSMAEPNQMKSSYDISKVFRIQPLLTLTRPFLRNITANCIDWNGHYPYDLITTGFSDGQVAVWKLDQLALCSSKTVLHDVLTCFDHEQMIGSEILACRTYNHCKCSPILSVSWLNEMMLVSTTLEGCKLYHMSYEGLYDDLANRVSYSKSEVHRLWADSVLLLDLILSRQSSSISLRSLSDSRFVSLVSVPFYINDMSLSSWMSLLAFVSDNGQLYATHIGKTCPSSKTKLKIFQLYSISLCSIQADYSNQTDNKKMKSILADQPVELDYCSSDKLLSEYYFLFDDLKKNKAPNLNSVEPLTKNDLNRPYGLTHCLWSPNASSHSWLFSATKSGICRLNNYSQMIT